jgi:chaperonin cofactor prefoldin
MADKGDKPISTELTEKRRKVEIMDLRCRIERLELRKMELADNMTKMDEEVVKLKETLTEKEAVNG